MAIMIVTNNCKVQEAYKEKCKVLFVSEDSENSCLRVLEQTRDFIHLGARLLSDPMAGKLRPHETPYKSILLETEIKPGAIQEKNGFVLDHDSVRRIESSIGMVKMFQAIRNTPDWSGEVKEDFMTVDLSLFRSAIQQR